MKVGLLGSERETRPTTPATTVEVLVGEARPHGISLYSTATESDVAVSSGKAGSARPGAQSTPSAFDAAVEMPADEARPGVAKQTATTESVITVSSGEAGPSWARANDMDSAAAAV